MSRPHTSGLVAFIALPDDAAVTVTFADDGSARDQTDWAADLLLIGFLEWAEQVDVAALVAPETVDVADVALTGATVDDVGVGVLSPPGGTGTLLEWPVAVEMNAAGVASQLTSGVATEHTDDLDLPWGIDPSAN